MLSVPLSGLKSYASLILMKYKTLISLPIMLLYSASLFALDTTKSPVVKPVIDPLSGTNVVQMLVGLLFVLMLVIVVAWLLRRVGGVSMAGGGVMNVVGGMSMGARERVVLLQVGEEQILIGVSPGRIQKLHVLENPVDIQLKKQNEISFANKLSEALRGKAK